jgi:hypothetical protein
MTAESRLREVAWQLALELGKIMGDAAGYHLVGAGEHGWRNIKADGLRGLEVDRGLGIKVI